MEYYDMNAPLLGFMGAAIALIFSNLGAAYGTGKSGMGISALGVGKPELVMKSIVPVCVARGCRGLDESRAHAAVPRRSIDPLPGEMPGMPNLFPVADKDSQCLSSESARDTAPAQVVMAGVLGIYGLIIAVIIANAVSGVEQGRPAYGMLYARQPHPSQISPCLPRIGSPSVPACPCHPPPRRLLATLPTVSIHDPRARSSAMAHFGGGLACGLSGLAAGLAIGIVGDTCTRAAAEQPKLFVGMVLILIFAEALGLYGLIVGLILASKA